MRVRCHKAVIQPTGSPLRIYFGEEGREHLIHDVQLCDDSFEAPDTSGLFICVGPYLLIWVEDPDDPVVVAHEALHAATYVWEKAGANLHVYNNDEVLTYTMGHIMDLIYHALEINYELQNCK